MHCTEAAEAKHKTCMGLASHRVKHLRQNHTQNAMLRYQQRHCLFELMHQQEVLRAEGRKQYFPPKFKILLPLQVHTIDGPIPVTMGDMLHTVEQQESFLHKEVRIARVELMDMLCSRLELAKTRLSYNIMNRLQWSFGQKLVTSSKTYWSTDSNYICPTSENKSRRRDKFLLLGTENIRITLGDGREELTPTAFCCEAVCFLSIDGLLRLRMPLSAEVKAELVDGGPHA